MGNCINMFFKLLKIGGGSMKKRIFLSLFTAVSVMSLLAGCGNNVANNNNNGGDGIKIGLNYELTGGVASYGESSVNGIMMAFDEINAAGGINGKQIIPVKIDNKSESAEATSVATRLMTQEGVVLSLGPATSGNFMATIPVAQQNKIPVLSSSSTADVGVTADAKGNVYDYAFRLCFKDSFQGITMSNFASNNLGAKKAVIIKQSGNMSR